MGTGVRPKRSVSSAFCVRRRSQKTWIETMALSSSTIRWSVHSLVFLIHDEMPCRKRPNKLLIVRVLDDILRWEMYDQLHGVCILPQCLTSHHNGEVVYRGDVHHWNSQSPLFHSLGTISWFSRKPANIRPRDLFGDGFTSQIYAMTEDASLDFELCIGMPSIRIDESS